MTVPVEARIEPPPAADPSSLPSNSIPSLKLVQASPEEARQCAIINGQCWNGPLSLPAYLRREQHLGAQAHAARGGLTNWVLVDTSDGSSPRVILSACETLRKRAIVAHRGGVVEDTVTHGIGSVFARDEYRGRGYAGRMMKELNGVLEDWQQENGKKARFNVLYSDIGKKFYSKNGWHPFPSAHISLPPVSDRDSHQGLPYAVPLYAGDLEALCKLDEQNLRKDIMDFPDNGPNLRVAILPDVDVMRWHHAREEFLAYEMFRKHPESKGVSVRCSDGSRVWVVWSRSFAKTEHQNTLYILRAVVEHGTAKTEKGSNSAFDNRSTDQDIILAMAACLSAAQLEAMRWNMKSVEIWNPSAVISAAVRLLDPTARMTHRETESIASLLWYGPTNSRDDIEWVCNEKYGWC